MTCLANDLEPSILAAAASGPKHATPFARSASAAPATSGASGPMTTRSGLSLRASARVREGLGGGEGLGPAVEVLVDRHRVVELGLCHRDLVVPLPAYVVGHAHRH